MAKKFAGLLLAALGASDFVEREELRPDKGEKVMGIILKMLIPISNTTGGALATGLSAAQKLALLDCFRFSMTYGKDGQFATPFESRSLRDMRKFARICYASELEGFNDATTGLNRNMPNASTTNVTLFVVIPTGKLWAFDGKERNILGMGRSQTRTVRAELRRVSDTIAANIAISGSVTVETLLDTVPCKGDPWCVIPQYFRTDDAKEEVVLPDGLPLHLEEASAVHVSSALTNFSVRIDDQFIHRLVSAQESIREQTDAARLPAAGLITDESTVLYSALDGEKNFADLPSGKLVFRQEGTKQIATVQLFYAYVPCVEAERIANEVKQVAVNMRGKPLLAISENAIDGYGLPSRLNFAVPMRLVDQDDAEFQRFPGLYADEGSSTNTAVPHVPTGLADAAKQRYSAHMARGEAKAAEAVISELSAAIPGAIISGRGFSRGSQKTRNEIVNRYFR